MVELVQQFSINAPILIILFVTASLFLFAAGWAAIQFTRATQLLLATNVGIARELAILQQSMATPGAPVRTVAAPFVPSSAPSPAPVQSTTKIDKNSEGEMYGYSDEELADQEAIRTLKRRQATDGSMMSDEELAADIDHFMSRAATEEN